MESPSVKRIATAAAGDAAGGPTSPVRARTTITAPTTPTGPSGKSIASSLTTPKCAVGTVSTDTKGSGLGGGRALAGGTSLRTNKTKENDQEVAKKRAKKKKQSSRTSGNDAASVQASLTEAPAPHSRPVPFPVLTEEVEDLRMERSSSMPQLPTVPNPGLVASEDPGRPIPSEDSTPGQTKFPYQVKQLAMAKKNAAYGSEAETTMSTPAHRAADLGKNVTMTSSDAVGQMASMKTQVDAVGQMASMKTQVDEQLVHFETAPPQRISSAVKESNSALGPRSLAWRARLARMLETPTFKGVMLAVLMVALFGTSAFVVFDTPDEPGIVLLDTIMSVIMVIFLLELVVTSFVCYRTYMLSAFFWMDLLGTISMAFEISYMLGTHAKAKDEVGGTIDTVLLRSARAAKLGARIGRLAKTMKCLAAVYKTEKTGLDGEASDPNDVKYISRKLMLLLSTKVSVLALTLMLVAPMFQLAVYPEADFSMKAWAHALERAYSKEVQHSLAFAKLEEQAKTNSTAATIVASDFYKSSKSMNSRIFRTAVEDMLEFYADSSYAPYDLVGFPEKVEVDGVTVSVFGASLAWSTAPNRIDSCLFQAVDTCTMLRENCDGTKTAFLAFDFSGPRRMEAAMDSCLIVFVLLVMLVCTFDLSRTLDVVVLTPLNRIMGMVRKTTSTILIQVSEMIQVSEEDEPESAESFFDVSEIQMLELVLKKLAVLTKLWVQDNVVDENQMMNLNLEGRGVIVDMLRLGRQRGSTTSPCDQSMPVTAMSTSEFTDIVGTKMSVDVDSLDSWNFDVLSASEVDLDTIVLHLFFRTQIGMRVRQYTSAATLSAFWREAKSRYTDQPYHNWIHAVDVCHTVHQSLKAVHSAAWLDTSHVFALMVAALCHDAGHFGRTNNFLVETRHDLAIRYNDKSPLENMHCATLFEICTKEASNVFARHSNTDYSSSRAVCINAILHTDNCHHFEMVKEISKIYEMNKPVCDSQAKDFNDLSDDYLEHVLCKNETTILQLILHLSDVSNPLQNFTVCKAWAERVMAEFFSQGDEEQHLSIPVGMLNDRKKVNFPSSQHGFIVFLVAPLVSASVSLFQPLLPLAQAMTQNLDEWCRIWETEVSPSMEDITKRQKEISTVKTTIFALEDRECTNKKEFETRRRQSGRKFSVARKTFASAQHQAHASSTQ